MLKLDDRLVCRLLGEDRLDPALTSFCTLFFPHTEDFFPHTADEVEGSGEEGEALLALIQNAQSTGDPLRLYFSGPQAESKRREARWLATATGAPLLALDLSHALAQMIDFEQLTRRLLDELRSRHAILYVEPFDLLLDPDRAGDRQRLLEMLAEYDGVTILSGVQSKLPRGRGTHGQLQVDWPIPSHDQRMRSWRGSLDAAGEAVDEDMVDMLAGRFVLMPDQISDAVAGARIRSDWRMATSRHNSDDSPRRPLELRDLFEAARAQSDSRTGRVWPARSSRSHGWDQIVLPDDTVAQLREMCQQVVHRHRVLDEWGFGRRLSARQGRHRAVRRPVRHRQDDGGRDHRPRAGSRPLQDRPVGRRQQVHRRDREEPRAHLRRGRERQRDPVLRRGRRAVRQALARCATPTTATPTSRSPTCCRRWSSTKASRSWPPTCARTWTRRSSGGSASSSTSRSRTRSSGPRSGASSSRRGQPRVGHRLRHCSAAQLRITGGNIKNIVLGAAFLAAGADEPDRHGAPAAGHPPRVPEDRQGAAGRRPAPGRCRPDGRKERRAMTDSSRPSTPAADVVQGPALHPQPG